MSQIATADLSEPTSRRGFRFATIAAIAVLAVGWLVYQGLSGNTAYYLEVGELLARGQQVHDQQVRVAGKVQPGSIQRDGPELQFVAADATGAVKVAYNGVVPDIFNDNVDVVVEGKLTPQGAFEAHTLMAKCPSKFEAGPGAAASTSRAASTGRPVRGAPASTGRAASTGGQ